MEFLSSATFVNGSIALAKITTSGTASSSNVLRGDGLWTNTLTGTYTFTTVTCTNLQVSGGTVSVPTQSIALASLPNGAATSVLGVAGGTAAARADITASTNDRLLARTGGTLGFVQVTAGMIPNDLVSNAMLRNSTGLSVIGRSAGTSGDPADIAAGGSRRFLASDSSNSNIAFRVFDLLDLPTIDAYSVVANNSSSADVPTTVAFTDLLIAMNLAYLATNSTGSTINEGTVVQLDRTTGLIVKATASTVGTKICNGYIKDTVTTGNTVIVYFSGLFSARLDQTTSTAGEYIILSETAGNVSNAFSKTGYVQHLGISLGSPASNRVWINFVPQQW